MATKALSHILKYWQTNINVKMFISTWWAGGKKLQSSFKMWLCDPHACKWSCSIFLIYLQYAGIKADHPYEKKKIRNFLMTESFHPYSLLSTISGAHGTWGMEVAAAEGPPRLACYLSLEFLWWLFALDCSDLCQRTRLHTCPSPAPLSHLSHHGHTHTIEEKVMR